MKARSSAHLIVRSPGIQGGEPVVRATRVPVRSIALARDEDALDVSSIAREFCIDVEAVEAALAYYDNHKAEIDRLIDRHEREARTA